ncbi:hypothetical protein QBC34DRAFT_126027 [Podospora aff. communis PSN243]|uniref:Uncharacterized protein n=1 Tax=Podospora aff. communis PSN243 TaxID=3040156 RepID=A0AAV9GHN8_9PEZI|nr:hypothetical protein QBC34DRAFT_126027 [Podospora aff. communis PSN243]
MCYQEFIAYQCGHRSMGVVRPCPLTTAAQNLKPCSSQPTKQYNALTMCVACERTLHFRWVLVREWEHRWMHERGVCECDVYFPGLLHRPRVSGYEALESLGGQGTSSIPEGGNGFRGCTVGNLSGNNNAKTAPDVDALGKKHGEMTLDAGFHHIDMGKYTEGAMTQGYYSAPGQETVNPPESGTVPQTYSEMTINGERRVAIRVPGLYAAEWLADHRVLHVNGSCDCPSIFTPLKSNIDESGLSTAQRQFLKGYRHFEKNGNEMSREEIDDRVREITRMFGTFVPIKIDETKPNNHQLSSVAVPEVVTDQPTQEQYAYVHISQTTTAPPEQFQMCPQVHATTLASTQPHLVAGYRNESETSVSAALYNTQRVNPEGAVSVITGVPGSSLWYGVSTSTSQPLGTTFWPPHAQFIPGSNPATLIGPGPFTTTGLDFSPGFANDSSAPTQGPLPLCGLPVGAGPEGESHMPHWSGCRLTQGPVQLSVPPRSQSSCSL